MDAWLLETSIADLLMDAALLGGGLLLATVLRRYVPVLQRFLIPNALVAGFIGLVLGPEILGVVPIVIERMGAYVYHLLALTFICVGLHGGRQRRSYGAVNLGFMQVMSMLLQGLTGLTVVALVILLIDPTISPAAGVLLPLGFAMGPGVAYSIGSGWQAYGFAEGPSVGLSLAAIGFLVAYILGVLIVHREGHRGEMIPRSDRTGIRAPDERTVAGHLTLSPAAVEPLAIHVAMVAAVYAGTYGIASGMAALLSAAGASSEIPVVWSFHFIIANLLALAVRRVMDATRTSVILDDGLLNRLTGLMADFLIAASIMAISLSIAARYAFPIILLALSGIAVTYFALRFAASKVFASWRLERFVGMFGEMTGTVTSGLALLRILDPEFRSPVAQDLVLSSGIALGFAFPLLVAINLPYSVFGGSVKGFLVLAAIMAVYLIVLMAVWYLYFKKTRGTAAAES